MTTLRQAAEQALEALELWGDSLTDPSAIPGWRFSVVGEKAIANLRAALASQTVPTHRITSWGHCGVCRHDRIPGEGCARQECLDSPKLQAEAGLIPLYTAPPQRDPLTDVQQDMESACQESRQVEPVAYVTGYSKGYATVKPLDPCLLMCVGMALYRSPPKFKQLTDEDIAELCTRYGVGYPPVVSPYTRRLIEAVEQKLMEKNKS